MESTVMVPNSQPDSQMSNAPVSAQEPPPQTSFSSAADAIATPPSSQSPAPQEKAIDTTSTQTPRISPSRPYTPSLEVPSASQRAGSSISSPSSRSSSSPTRGTKRTANGLMKMTDDAAMASPGTALGAARRESVSSSSGRINELSMQLKTRLKYAMVKVQNGWEQHSLDEVENIVTSQMSSPATIANGPYRNKWQSPRDARTNRNRLSRDFATPQSAQANMASLTSSAWSGYAQGSPAGYGPVSNSPGRLAPAPEMMAPSRSAQSQSSSSSGQAAQNAFAARGVSHARTRALRASTPTQQEQDAVDTLLFMSSPANSANFANAASPGRGGFAVPQQHHRPGYGHTKRPSIVSHRSMSSEDVFGGENRQAISAGEAAERQAKRRSFGRLQSNKDVDKLLDEIADADTEDEETRIDARSPQPPGTVRQ